MLLAFIVFDAVISLLPKYFLTKKKYYWQNTKLKHLPQTKKAICLFLSIIGGLFWPITGLLGMLTVIAEIISDVLKKYFNEFKDNFK